MTDKHAHYPRGGVADTAARRRRLDHMLAAFSRRDQNDPVLFRDYIDAFGQKPHAGEQAVILFVLAKQMAENNLVTVRMPADCPCPACPLMDFRAGVDTMVNAGLIATEAVPDGIDMTLTMATINEMDIYLRRQKCDPIRN